MTAFLRMLAGFFRRLVSSQRALAPADRQRSLENTLALRLRDYKEAKAHAIRMRAEYEQHAAEGDWSREELDIHLVNGRRELYRANLLRKQVDLLQQNLQTLSTAVMSRDILADGAIVVEREELEALDRSYFELQRQREGVAEAERNLTANLLADDDESAVEDFFALDKKKATVSEVRPSGAKIEPAAKLET